MAEEIKGLIEKIQQEGVEAAERKARQIEDQANRRAEAIVASAKKEAQKLLEQAKGEIAKMEKSGRASLEQAGRDLLLSLRREVNALLERLVLAQVRQALTPEQMANIIATLSKELKGKKPAEVVVSLKEADLKKLEKALLGRLGSEVKKGITLKPRGEISGGFIISYDSGSSHYDFTDKGIAEYLSLRLRPKLAQILNKAASSGKTK